MLTMVLAESELELIPTELCHHPAVIAHARQRAKNPRQILLDSNYDHAAMIHLPEGRRRGRPDIAHLFLLTVLESVANKRGLLNIFIHTRNDMVITVNPKTRIMRNYDRFLGLIEQLFEGGIIPEKSQPLLTLTKGVSLEQLIHRIHAERIIALSKGGTSVVLPDFFHTLKEQNTQHQLCIIGGFPSGSFHTDLQTIATDIISLYHDMLPAWTVASEILVNYGNMYR